ncbi:hypothetical protein XH98_37390 [Bradyrhizobium sp. CCBAU 51745]|nr:hypothetical protein [Bradyrhizobium sp. CCBAU 51745]
MLVAPFQMMDVMNCSKAQVSAMEDAARQPGVRTHGLVGRDLPIHDPGPDAATVIDEAAAHGAQFALVQLFTVSIATLGHLCLPLLWRGPFPLIS